MLLLLSLLLVFSLFFVEKVFFVMLESLKNCLMDDGKLNEKI